MDITQKILKNNPTYSNPTPLTPKGIVLHSVGVAQSKPAPFLRNWNRKTAKVSVHAIIDSETGEVVQLLPWDIRAWHCGGQGNHTHIGIEMCESKAIEYTSGTNIKMTDPVKARMNAKTAYDKAVELCAELCDKFDIDPMTGIISHSEAHLKGMASNHVDPEHYWTQLNTGFSMDGFRNAVQSKLGKTVKASPETDKTIDYIWKTLSSALKLPPVAIAAIMGNIQAESAFKPMNLQNAYNKKWNLTDEQYTYAVDAGTITRDMFINDKAGYGLAQWTYSTRKAMMYDYIKSKGASIGDLEQQVSFMVYEFATKYNGIVIKLMNEKSLREATKLILTQYERPADQSEKELQKRLTYAQSLYIIYVNEHLYRVRRFWTAPETQVGAYKDLNNAINKAKAFGLNVFDENGTCLYKS